MYQILIGQQVTKPCKDVLKNHVNENLIEMAVPILWKLPKACLKAKDDKGKSIRLKKFMSVSSFKYFVKVK